MGILLHYVSSQLDHQVDLGTNTHAANGNGMLADTPRFNQVSQTDRMDKFRRVTVLLTVTVGPNSETSAPVKEPD